MKYGRLFRNYIEDFAHTPSTNRCSTLPYKELKLMAKNMYPIIKDEIIIDNINNPLINYQRKDQEELAISVYEALNLMY